MKAVRKLIRRTFNAAGLDIRRLRTVPSPLIHLGIELVFDVGANLGQYAIEARAAGYAGRIVSFEPLPDAHAILAGRAKTDPHWTVHPRCAVGAAAGTAEINIAGNSHSSSLLPMRSAHADAAPESVYVGKARTDVITLDAVFDTYRTGSQRTFVKIDTQGFEAQVLAGLSGKLAEVFAVELELSTVPLYGDQDLYPRFFEFFETHGFKLWSLTPEFTDLRTGRTLQFDAVFVREA